MSRIRLFRLIAIVLVANFAVAQLPGAPDWIIIEIANAVPFWFLGPLLTAVGILYLLGRASSNSDPTQPARRY